MTLLYETKKSEKTFLESTIELEGIESKTPEEAHRSIVDVLYNQQKLIDVLVQDNNEMWKIISDCGLNIQENDSDNLELNNEQIKKIILNDIKIGQVFYPSDIAIKNNMDLAKVVEVIEELKKENKLTEVKSDGNLS